MTVPFLPDKLDQNACVEVRVNGTVVATRRIVDFVGDVSGTDDGEVITVNLLAPTNLPTSDEGLDPGELWCDTTADNVIKQVPEPEEE